MTLRILLSKVGLDGHDRGIKALARALRDRGAEVIYLGLHRWPADIASAAVQEDVDVVGISIHSGAHLVLIPELMAGLRDLGAGLTPVLVGGIIPREDISTLLNCGVTAVFLPGQPLVEIVDFIWSSLAQRPVQEG